MVKKIGLLFSIYMIFGNGPAGADGKAPADIIRVGMINCDLHAMYYAALFEGYDPLKLRDDTVGRGHAAYFYMHTFYNDPARMTVPKAKGLILTKVWDRNISQAENMSRIFDGHPRVCNSFEEVSDGVDLVFIADCNGEGQDHYELAAPGLKKRVPTFIDKPLAYDYVTAKKLVDLADKESTPLMSFSILQALPNVHRFKSRFAEIEAPEFGFIKGGWDTLAGQIHAITLALTLFGDGVESVECMGETPLACVHLGYGEAADRPKAGVLIACASGGTYHATFNAGAFSSSGVLHADDFNDYTFPYGALQILEKIKTMVKSGKPDAAYYKEMLEGVAIVSAARRAQETGKRVFLKDIFSETR